MPDQDSRSKPTLASRPSRTDRSVPLVLFTLIAIQAIGFGWLGVNRAGWLWSQSAQFVANLIAIVCTVRSFRRGRGFARQFWFLLTCSLVVWGVANGVFLHRTYAGLTNNSTTFLNFLYRAYGVPVLVILLVRRGADLFENDLLTVLDSVQIGIVVLAIYLALYSPSTAGSWLRDALVGNISLSNNLENIFLVSVTAVRLRWSSSRTVHSLLVKLLWFLTTYAAISAFGNYVSEHGQGVFAAWSDLLWTVPYCVAAIIALPGTASRDEEPATLRDATLMQVLDNNLFWAALVILVAILAVNFTGTWHLLGTAAVGASVLVYAVRLSITQYRQAGSIRALTQIKRDLDQLSTRNARILDSAGEGILGIDMEGRHTFVNPAAAQMFGYTTEEMIGQHSHSMWHHTRKDGTIYPKEECPVYSALRDGTVHRGGDEMFWRKDGTNFVGEFVSTPIHLDGDLLGGVVVLRDITDRRQVEVALRASQNMIECIIESAMDAIIAVDAEQHIVLFNAAAETMFRCPAAEVLGKPIDRFIPVHLRAIHDQHFQQFALEGTTSRAKGPLNTLRGVRADGEEFQMEASISRVQTVEQKLFTVILRDVTERVALEEQLVQAQKMEAVGRLVGGIAHDFNNILSVIIGYSDISKDHLDQGNPLTRNLEQMKRAGERAAALIRQLMAFSRKQPTFPRILDLNKVANNLHDMLQRMVGEDISIVLKLGDGLGPIRADIGQIEQVFLNLAVNARDAMPKGGEIRIETAGVELDESFVFQDQLGSPGNYVMLSFSDTGCGMDEATQSRIFEPFFTTKEIGKGTGLGLSTVYGIVKQSSGYIRVFSQLGKGTTFTIYFPNIGGPAEPLALAEEGECQSGSGTILVVEDDEAVRQLATIFLESAGYAVLEARDGETARDVVKRHSGPIDLLLTDVIMPRMSGVEVSAHLSILRPGIKVLFMSGYTGDLIVQHGAEDRDVEILEKPFTKSSLLGQVSRCLSSKSS